VLALEHRPLPVLAPARAAAARASPAPRSPAVAVLASAIRVVRAIVATLSAL
jgi:hypothetical protein